MYRDDTQAEITEGLMEAFQQTTLAIPNSDMGDYNHSFKRFGFDEVKVVQQGSSAGDWQFGVRRGDVWYSAFQENRFPMCGFRYSVDYREEYLSFEHLMSEME